MNRAKCNDLDYINFVVAAQKVFSAVEASESHPSGEGGPAHDAYTRLLQRLRADSAALWQEVPGLVKRQQGVLILDDSTLEKPYASQIELVSRHWSGKQHQVVNGINLISWVWTEAQRGGRLPCDFRVYHKSGDGLNKNDHFQAMLQQAKARGFQPELVAFDSWYSSLDNLKLIRYFGWQWLTQLKKNRQVSIDRTGNRPLEELLIPLQGLIVHLKGYGFIKVFRTVDPHGNAEFWATSQLEMSLEQAAWYALDAWQIEVYHRGLKQFTGIERAQFRLAISQRNHIGLAIRAFVRLEVHRLTTGQSWFEAKTAILRAAVRAYLAHPTLSLPSTA